MIASTVEVQEVTHSRARTGAGIEADIVSNRGIYVDLVGRRESTSQLEVIPDCGCGGVVGNKKRLTVPHCHKGRVACT